MDQTNSEDGFFKRIKDKTNGYLDTLPFTTRFFFILCVILFLIEKIIQIQLSSVCFSPRLLSLDFVHNFYKMIISNFFHLDLLHILFNMLSFIPLGTVLEKNKFGSLRFFYIVLLFGALIPMMAFILSLVSNYLEIGYSFYSCSVGFSGCVFALLTIHFFNDSLVSLYGMTRIPAKLYPWAILIITNFIFPQSSLVGHLSGILIAILYMNGYLNCFIISERKFCDIELSNHLNFMTNQRGFITNSNFSCTSSFVNLDSPSSLDSNFTRLKRFFGTYTSSNSGRQLGTVLSNQLERENQSSFSDNNNNPNTEISCTNNDINVNTQQQQLQQQQQQQPSASPTILKYSPMIDMSKI
ncbi:hypothetical protein RB653_002376 [Dictyostelium firmibasis]|uniref:Peptidase S54 rhomboid domain-containing protein n=1 Tax=Dictyostelium firmibasis TaxID=79012 RepID=A0AAN7TYA5_9MYCE